MLAFDRHGAGPTLVLLHGTNSNRHVWDPLLPRLAAERDVIAVDLPGHGESPATAFSPPGFAREVAALLDELGLDAPPVVGHSSGGWTALELAKLGRAGAVLALAPAGMWRDRSPVLTNIGLRVNWRLGQIMGSRPTSTMMRSGLARRMALRWISAQPSGVPYETAVATADAAIAAKNFPRHFAETRVLRFAAGASIPPHVPVRLVWGADDRVAPAKRSRFADELPTHAEVEVWPRCGHMVTWDCADRAVEAALATTLPSGSAA